MHLILALGIVREPTVWDLLLHLFIYSRYSCTHCHDIGRGGCLPYEGSNRDSGWSSHNGAGGVRVVLNRSTSGAQAQRSHSTAPSLQGGGGGGTTQELQTNIGQLKARPPLLYRPCAAPVPPVYRPYIALYTKLLRHADREFGILFAEWEHSILDLGTRFSSSMRDAARTAIYDVCIVCVG